MIPRRESSGLALYAAAHLLAGSCDPRTIPVGAIVVLAFTNSSRNALNSQAAPCAGTTLALRIARGPLVDTLFYLADNNV